MGPKSNHPCPGRKAAGQSLISLFPPSHKRLPAVVVISPVLQAYGGKSGISGPAGQTGNRDVAYHEENDRQAAQPACFPGACFLNPGFLNSCFTDPPGHPHGADDHQCIEQYKIVSVHLGKGIDACNTSQCHNRNQDQVKENPGVPPVPALYRRPYPDKKEQGHQTGSPGNDHMVHILRYGSQEHFPKTPSQTGQLFLHCEQGRIPDHMAEGKGIFNRPADLLAKARKDGGHRHPGQKPGAVPQPRHRARGKYQQQPSPFIPQGETACKDQAQQRHASKGGGKYQCSGFIDHGQKIGTYGHKKPGRSRLSARAFFILFPCLKCLTQKIIDNQLVQQGDNIAFGRGRHVHDTRYGGEDGRRKQPHPAPFDPAHHGRPKGQYSHGDPQ